MARGSQHSHYTSTAECIVALCWSAYVYDSPIGIMETHRLVIFRCAFFSGTNLAYSPTSIWQKHRPISLSYNDWTSDSPLDNQVKIPAGLVS